MRLPKTWNDITISQYIDLLPSAYKGMNEVEKVIHSLSILTEQSKDEVRALSIDQAKEYNSKLSFLNELPSSHYKATFKLNGVRYRVEPNANKMSAGSYITTMHLFQDLANDPEKIEKNLHIILAQVVQPIKRKGFKWVNYEIDRMKIAEDFYNGLSMEVAYPICVFFCHLSKHLIPIIEDYSTKTLKRTMKELTQMEKDLKSGDGL